MTLRQLKRFAEGSIVGIAKLREARLFLVGRAQDVKLIGGDALDRKLTVRVHAATETARKAVEKAGGKVEIIKNMFDWRKLSYVFRIPEAQEENFDRFGLLVVFRITAIIPLPGIPRESLAALFGGNQLFGLLDIFSGGGLSNLSIVMLGIGPYITASIVMQLLTMIVPRLEEMAKEEGEAGRRKINQWTRVLTVPLTLLQAFGFINLLQQQGQGAGVALAFTPWQLALAIITITGGTMFLMWLGESLLPSRASATASR